MIQFNSLAPNELEHFLERHRSSFTLRSEINLDLVLKEILRKANEFVPSESGSILLDDPFRKMASRHENELVFIATFGSGSEDLVGHRLSARNGIVGRVYQTGSPYLSEDVAKDEYFFSKIDQTIGYKSQSIVCVPIYIGKNVCGVLELINRKDGTAFTERDMTLLEIFAGYTSFTLQNALDAKRAHDLAKKDDLTGLFNDRWFHVCLSESLQGAETGGRDCVLIFMDLDNFKKINDAHGHLAGSQVLREVGFILKRAVDREDAVIARYGGDEFVIILPEATLEEGRLVAESIREAIETNSFLDREYGFGLPALHLRNVLSASIGVARYTPTGKSGTFDVRKNDLLRRADAAMYEAKSRGKGRVVVNTDDTFTARTESA
jgi:diguanylate cyclase (GGDEF)-like protein